MVHLLQRLPHTPDGTTAAKRTLLHEVCLYLWPELKQRDLKELAHIVASCSRLDYPVDRFYSRCLRLVRKKMRAGVEVGLLAKLINAFASASAVLPSNRGRATQLYRGLWGTL
jgi:hypothetical protein